MRVLRIYPTANDARHRRRDHALRRRGIEVGLVAPVSYGSDIAPSEIEPVFPVWRSRLANRRSIPLHLWDPRVLRRAVREFRPDVVDIHEEPYFPAGAQTVHAAASRPVVMQANQNIAKAYPAPIRAVRGWVFSRVAGLYPSSSEAGDVLRGWGFEGRVDVIPYGVEDELFDVQSRGERVGFIGRFVPEKGVGDLLGFGERLLCVGTGPLQETLRASGAEIVSARSTNDLARPLERMGVVVVPSRTTPAWKEQFGRVAAEAMAAGIPVVAYSSGALPDVVGDAGVLVREGAARELADSVERVLADPGELGRRGRERARQRFRWDVVAGQMGDLYAASMS